MHIVAILIIGAVMRGAWDHLRDDYRRSRDQKVKAAAKKAPGGKLTKAAKRKALRRHATGYWAGEISRGFPVTRTGWHAGWLAHKTAAEHQRAVRDAAQTTHLETVAQFAPGRAEAKRRHEALRKEISETLGQAPEGQRTGREAVQKAAGEVTARRAKRQRTGGKCVGCGAPDGYPCLQGCAAPKTAADMAALLAASSRPVPPLSADSVSHHGDPAWLEEVGERYQENGEVPSGWSDAGDPVYPEDSSWLRPGEPRCEGCGGRGSALGGTCPACRGFGSAPASPLSPLAPSGAICGACGQGEKPGDPVLAAQGGYNIHLSHAKEQQEAYWNALNLMRAKADAKKAEADFAKASMAGDEAGVEDAIGRHEEAYQRITAAGGELDTNSSGEPGPDAARNPRPPDAATDKRSRRIDGVPYDPAKVAEGDAESANWDGPPEGRYDSASEAEADFPGWAGSSGDYWSRLGEEGRGLTDAEYRAEYRKRKVAGTLPPPRKLRSGETLSLTSASPSTTEGAPQVTADTNYTTVQAKSASLAAAADQDLAAIRQRKQQAQQLAEDMQAANVDPASISAAMDAVDRYAALEQAAVASGEQAGAIGTTLQHGHGGIKEAHDNAPVKAAVTEFYEGD